MKSLLVFAAVLALSLAQEEVKLITSSYEIPREILNCRTLLSATPAQNAWAVTSPPLSLAHPQPRTATCTAKMSRPASSSLTTRTSRLMMVWTIGAASPSITAQVLPQIVWTAFRGPQIVQCKERYKSKAVLYIADEPRFSASLMADVMEVK